MNARFSFLLAGLACAGSVWAAPSSSRPTGFRFFNQHLTVKPYVSVSYTYDSNIDSDHEKANGDSIFAVNPGIDFDWHGDKWEVAGNVWYRWNGYCQNNGRMGANSFGESLAYKYSTAEDKGQRGWTLMISERYSFISQSDSLNSGTGRGIWRDRDNIDANFLLERRFTERWHADLTGQYNYLNYHNDTGNYSPLYGWHRLSAGVDAGFVLSKWTDLLVAVGYSYYNQMQGNQIELSRNYSHDMQSLSVMGGLGTHLTEKIAYRLLGGYSWVNYGNAYDDGGFTYSVSANWRILRQLQTSLLGSSYYQPNESSCGSATKSYTVSWGLSYLTLADRMTLTADVAYRYHQNIYSDSVYDGMSWGNYDEQFLSFRLGANYLVNRWVSLFASVSYDVVFYDTSDNRDYDRWRGTVGMRFHY